MRLQRIGADQPALRVLRSDTVFPIQWQDLPCMPSKPHCSRKKPRLEGWGHPESVRSAGTPIFQSLENVKESQSSPRRLTWENLDRAC